MIQIQLSQEEIEKSEQLLDKFKTKYMCTMGPVFNDFVSKAMLSDEALEKFRKTAQSFVNSTYFSGMGDNDLPMSSGDILGIKIWQGKCTLDNCHLNEYKDTIIIDYHGSTFLVHDSMELSPLDIEKPFVELSEGRLVYHYNVELTFSDIFQAFLFIRSIWYYMEAEVCRMVFHSNLEPKYAQVLDSYVNIRKTIVDPLVELSFPSPDMVSKVTHLSKKSLETYYYKYFFSKVRSVQKKGFFLGRMMKGAFET